MDILLWDSLKAIMLIFLHLANKLKTRYLAKEFSTLLYKLFAQTIVFIRWQQQDKTKLELFH